jgi:hypothetical protein
LILTLALQKTPALRGCCAQWNFAEGFLIAERDHADTSQVGIINQGLEIPIFAILARVSFLLLYLRSSQLSPFSALPAHSYLFYTYSPQMQFLTPLADPDPGEAHTHEKVCPL